MSMQLAQALSQIELVPGTYCCQVKGHWIEIHVRKDQPLLAKPFDECDVMLDPWVDLPDIPATHRQKVTRRVSIPFDIPQIHFH